MRTRDAKLEISSCKVPVILYPAFQSARTKFCKKSNSSTMSRPRNSGPRKPTCCFCVHVRTGTICIGLWHLVAQALMLSVFVGVLLHPEAINDRVTKIQAVVKPLIDSGFGIDRSTPYPNQSNKLFATEDRVEEDKSILASEKTPEGEKEKGEDQDADEGYLKTLYWRAEPKITTRDLHVGIAVLSCMLVLTLLLVYGALRRKPAYLLPFFCLQVFDLCLTLLGIVGYVTYTPREWRNKFSGANVYVVDQVADDAKETAVESEWSNVLGCLAIVGYVFLKVYLVNVVWTCYRDLVQERRRRTAGLGDLEIANVAGSTGADSLTEQTVAMPPSYEQVTKDAADVKEGLVSDGSNYYYVKGGEIKDPSPPPPYPAAAAAAAKDV